MYHVTVRGNRGALIFDDDVDHRTFLEKLEAAVQAFHVRLYLFFPLKNHLHLLAETPMANLSDFMSRGVLFRHTVHVLDLALTFNEPRMDFVRLEARRRMVIE